MLSKKPWQPEFVLLFGAAMFACYGFVAVAAFLLHKSGLAGFQNPDDAGFALLGTLGIEGPAWIFILVFLRLHNVNWRDAFGLRGPDLKKSLLLRRWRAVHRHASRSGCCKVFPASRWKKSACRLKASLPWKCFSA